jgi:DMSO/TMAO reductase YedYZ molybdopterin-dependent catalytic subunit
VTGRIRTDDGSRYPRVLSTLPVHAETVSTRTEEFRLRVQGLVERPHSFSLAELEGLTLSTRVEDFECEEGWVVPGQRWEGVAVRDLLDLVAPQDTARYVEFAAGEFAFSLPLEEAESALVALRLNGAPLEVAHGGPSRLAVPDAACFTSIKWLDRIEVTRCRGANRAEFTARARMRERLA